MKKYITVAVILLFIGVAVAPSIDANNSIIKKDISFPSPIIEQPKSGCIYFLANYQLYLQAFKYLNITGIIGKITIKVSHPDSKNVSRIEFYVNNLKRWVDRSPPYSWTWRFSLMPLNVVKVVAVSHMGETASAEVVVYRLF